MNILPIIDPEFKGLIPSLSSEEREQLEQNIISKRKCRDAIVLWEGIIIDGHNRYEICVKHGIEFKVEELQLSSREAAKVWILENQLARRNLSKAMRIEVVMLKEELLRKIARKKQSEAGGDKKSEGSLLSKMKQPNDEQYHVRKDIAAESGVSEGTLYSYTQVKEHGSPELLASVQSGELKINTAHRLLTKEIIKQLSRADKMYKFISEAIPPEGLQAANPEMYEKLADLAATLRELISKLAIRPEERSTP